MPERLPTFVGSLRNAIGPAGLLTDPADVFPYLQDWRGLYQGRALAVVRPATTQEVAAAVRLCAESEVAIVPQGGNTSMVGGATPKAEGDSVVLVLSRMNQVRAVDPLDMTITLDAGVTLKAAQEAAQDAGCLLPLSIAAEGTAQIGGVLATNAGGNTTVRYGNARDLVLGLEVVLPDGSIWNGLRRLRKDNTGYALRQLFVGSEGTLGVITGAVLKLVPQPLERAAALCALPTAESALALFGRLQREDAPSIQAFEYMSAQGMDLVLRHIPDTALPLSTSSGHFVLIDLATSRRHAGLESVLETTLADAMTADEIDDAVLAQSEAQRSAFWKLREEHAEAQKREGASVKNDVSVPVSRVPELLARGIAAVAEVAPGARPVPFGHIGDGNIHFNFSQPEGGDPAAFMALAPAIMAAVAEVVQSLDGSFSAEHGIGQLKTHMMPAWRGGPELSAMRAIKAALDPRGTMNPGKLFG